MPPKERDPLELSTELWKRKVKRLSYFFFKATNVIWKSVQRSIDLQYFFLEIKWPAITDAESFKPL
ncbi:hypothetical protein E2320_013359 [Naja naja]|nr:hypothetical protein E2320_013359 [Naja naja]